MRYALQYKVLFSKCFSVKKNEEAAVNCLFPLYIGDDSRGFLFPNHIPSNLI